MNGCLFPMFHVTECVTLYTLCHTPGHCIVTHIQCHYSPLTQPPVSSVSVVITLDASWPCHLRRTLCVDRDSEIERRRCSACCHVLLSLTIHYRLLMMMQPSLHKGGISLPTLTFDFHILFPDVGFKSNTSLTTIKWYNPFCPVACNRIMIANFPQT